MGETALRRMLYSLVGLVAAALGISGCGGVGVARQGAEPAAIPAGSQGVVRGGQQPVTGATVQLYAVGTTGDGSAAMALLSPAAMTSLILLVTAS